MLSVQISGFKYKLFTRLQLPCTHNIAGKAKILLTEHKDKIHMPSKTPANKNEHSV